MLAFLTPTRMSSFNQELVVLLVEDNAADAFLVREAIREQGLPFELHVVSDGEKALSFFDQMDASDKMPCPNFLLLDLNLPRVAGDEVLARVKKSAKCSGMPVVVLTSSDSPVDRDRAIRLGANEYFLKPCSLEGFMELGQVINRLWREKWSSSA